MAECGQGRTEGQEAERMEEGSVAGSEACAAL